MLAKSGFWPSPQTWLNDSWSFELVHQPKPFTILIGTKFLAKAKELGDVYNSDLVHSAGYVSITNNGIERLNFTALYEALLEANGIHLGAGSSGGKGKPGSSLSYATKIQFNGNLLVGKAYTAQLGLKTGDEFEIKLGRKQIQLIPLGAAEEESGTAGVQWLGQDRQPLCLSPPAAVPPSKQRGRPIRSSALTGFAMLQLVFIIVSF